MFPQEGRIQRRVIVSFDDGRPKRTEYEHTLTAAEVIDDHMDYTDNRGCGCPYGWQVLNWLNKAGYVVVHPDDVPTSYQVGNEEQDGPEFFQGWACCWREVFRRPEPDRD